MKPTMFPVLFVWRGPEQGRIRLYAVNAENLDILSSILAMHNRFLNSNNIPEEIRSSIRHFAQHARQRDNAVNLIYDSQDPEYGKAPKLIFPPEWSDLSVHVVITGESDE